MSMTTTRYRPGKISPIRHDAPGEVMAMPSPAKIHHIHIYSDVCFDEMVPFYCRLLNARIVTEATQGAPATFLSYDDHDHRIIIFKKPGFGTKPERPVGVSHIAFAYASLGEILYIYRRMKDWGYPPPHWAVNHGNSTSIYYRDPDGNEVETLVDNYAPIDCQEYKKRYQFTEEFGAMRDGDFDPDKMVALYEAGVPDSILLDREEVKRLKREGKL